jgi:Ras-related GTP-binding protein A/B
MDSHLTAQSSTVFRAVHSLIYIFDAESPDLMTSDTLYFLKCLRALRDQNPTSSSNSTPSPSPSPSPSPTAGVSSTGEEGGPTVFILLHKMDLVPLEKQATKLAEFEADVTKKAREWGWKGNLQFYGTSIWNETLYKVRSLSRLLPARVRRMRLTMSSFVGAGLVNCDLAPHALPRVPPNTPLLLPYPLRRLRNCTLRTNNLPRNLLCHRRSGWARR